MDKDNVSYRELNWLLTDCLESERRYYNASEDIQEADLKRFLYHESVKRNHHAALITEKLLQAGCEPLKFQNKKGNLHRDGLEVKKILTSKKWKKYLIACIKQDERCLHRYAEILRLQELPKDILRMLQVQRKSLLEALDQAVIFKNRKNVPVPKLDPKVRKLRAM